MFIFDVLGDVVSLLLVVAAVTLKLATLFAGAIIPAECKSLRRVC